MVILGNIKNKNNRIAEPNVNVTTAQRSYTYAPGIATYGIKGLQGIKGDDGNSIFFTNLSFDNSVNLKDICSKIESLKILTDYSDYIYFRPYHNNDYIIDKKGNIFMLTDINQLIIDVRNNTINEKYTTYFSNIGLLPSDSDIFNQKNIRTGNTIITNIAYTPTNDVNTTLLTLISKPNNNITDFIDLNAIYNGIPSINFSIYYNSNTKGFHIDSNYPIYIDAPVSVKYTEYTEKTDEYSPILTTSNSITTYVSTCNDIKADINARIYQYTNDDTNMPLYGCVYTIEFKSKNENTNVLNTLANKTIHFQNGSYNDFQKIILDITVYRFVLKYDYVKANELYILIKNIELNNILISLIDNIEVFLTVDTSIQNNILYN